MTPEDMFKWAAFGSLSLFILAAGIEAAAKAIRTLWFRTDDEA